MTTLTDRLRALAEDAPDGEPARADDSLWQQGRRLQRRRRVVTGGLVTALVLGLGSFTTLAVDAVDAVDRVPAPVADADAVLGLPDRLYRLDPAGAGTDETGPIGPLVALVPGARELPGVPDVGMAGVSTAGAYAFLDLDAAADVLEARLSPDGRWVAYPVTGETRDEPNGVGGGPVVGVAVHDTVTGDTEQQLVPTDHGLLATAPLWLGDTLVFSYGQIVDASPSTATARDSVVLRWDVAGGTVERGPGEDLFYESGTPFGDRLAVPTGPRSFDVVSADGTTEPGPPLDVATDGAFVVSPDGEQVAVREAAGGRLLVAPMTGPDAGVTRPVAAVVAEDLVGWRDEGHVLVRSTAADGDSELVSVDVRTGETESLVQLVAAGFGTEVQLAADALGGPVFAAPEPDGPEDLRPLGWLGGALVLLLGAAALWRSRVRL
jgi:hypothetical protein